jgi:hypothetical protein
MTSNSVFKVEVGTGKNQLLVLCIPRWSRPSLPFGREPDLCNLVTSLGMVTGQRRRGGAGNVTR